MSGGGRGIAALCACAAVLLLTVLATAPALAVGPGLPVEDPDYGNPTFCGSGELANDFGLSALPPVNEPPFGRIPFGPKTVSLEVFSGLILTPGDSLGFGLHSSNFAGQTPLHWVLRSRVYSVDEMGHPGPLVAQAETRVGLINAAREVKASVDSPGAPGFYLYEIEFADFAGKTLAVYDRYIRVERRFWDARLGLSVDRLHRGEQLVMRVENHGTEWIDLSEEFHLQARRGGKWTGIDIPGRYGWLAWAGFLGPGDAWPCSAIDLPRDFPSGRYRVVKEVGRSISSRKTRTYWLTAPFRVLR